MRNLCAHPNPSTRPAYLLRRPSLNAPPQRQLILPLLSLRRRRVENMQVLVEPVD
jgi:hypothetical protein